MNHATPIAAYLLALCRLHLPTSLVRDRRCCACRLWRWRWRWRWLLVAPRYDGSDHNVVSAVIGSESHRDVERHCQRRHWHSGGSLSCGWHRHWHRYQRALLIRLEYSRSS